MGRKRKNCIEKIFTDCIFKRQNFFIDNGPGIRKIQRKKRKGIFNFFMSML